MLKLLTRLYQLSLSLSLSLPLFNFSLPLFFPPSPLSLSLSPSLLPSLSLSLSPSLPPSLSLSLSLSLSPSLPPSPPSLPPLLPSSLPPSPLCDSLPLVVVELAGGHRSERSVSCARRQCTQWIGYKQTRRSTTRLASNANTARRRSR